jgi:hypothetical protein
MVDDVGMTGRPDGQDDVEFLDVGPPDPPAGAGARGRRRGPWYALAAVVVVAGIVVASVHKNSTGKDATHSDPPTTAPATTPAGPSEPPPQPPTLRTVADVGHPLLDVSPQWQLFGRAPGQVVRLELARGRITTTRLPDLSSSGGVSLIAGPDQVIVRPLDLVPGYEVPDAHPSRPLLAALGQQGPVLPGPDIAHVWVPTDAGAQRRLSLVGMDGRPTGPAIPIPNDVGGAVSDGAGYAMFNAIGGVYQARPGAVRRITTGAVLAVGPTRWLTRECDARYRCANTVIDRATGAHRVLPGNRGEVSDTGVIAPDGSFAAMVRFNRQGVSTLSLLDLATGVATSTGVTFNPESGSSEGAFVWSPDSRWLFVASFNRRLVVLDRQTMKFTTLDADLPAVSQVALRTGSG